MSASTKFTLTRRILDSLAVVRRGQARRRKQVRLSNIEALEGRQLLSAAVTGKTVTHQGVKYTVATSVEASKPASASSASKAATAQKLVAPLSETFNLSSRPSATKTIYLDFNGHTTSGTPWNTFIGGANIVTPAYSKDIDPAFSNSELSDIQLVYQRVVEDYAPFDVNVTTKEPPLADLVKGGGGDTRWGIRVVIGGSSDDWLGGGAGGVAFLNSFNASSDIPTFVFDDSLGDIEKNIAEATSHEVGHTLGLNHDGTASVGYYTGNGTGVTSWGPIMGVSYNINVSQFSKGEYNGANNKEDDLAIITTLNGFTYRNDDYGNSQVAASQLASKKVGSIKTVNASGVIERNTDQDWFSFTTTGGNVSLNVAGDSLSPNLDVALSLYDALGTLLMVVNPANSLSASLAATLPAGAYAIMIDGVGFGTLATGYSDYGSIGQFSITGTIPDTSSGTASAGTSVISGRVLSDANANGVVDGTDAGIGGVMLFIDLDGNGVFTAAVDKSTRTDASGNFKFTGLLGGLYQIYQVVPAGWQQVSPAAGGLTVGVPAAGTTSNVFFRNARPPVLSSLGSTVTYKAGSAPVLLSAGGNVTDGDSATFGGGQLTIGITQNAGPTDIVAVRNQGNGAGQIGVFGGVVRYAGKVIGAVSGGIAGSNLVITFNSTASLIAVRAVLRNITFVATGAPSKTARTFALSLTDGTGTASAVVSKQVNVT